MSGRLPSCLASVFLLCLGWSPDLVENTKRTQTRTNSIHKCMIVEEQGWPKSQRETKKEYIARLKQTALDTPKAEIDKCMASMRRRCRALVDSGGEWTKGD